MPRRTKSLDVCRGCVEDSSISQGWRKMAQRILEPGQIETLAERSIPRIRLPDRKLVFARRAARLQRLATDAALGDYLRFLAVLVEAQHVALARLAAEPPARAHLQRSLEHSMPPIHATNWPLAQRW